MVDRVPVRNDVRAAMATYEYDDFWVEFSPREGGGYDVAARAPNGRTAAGRFELPFTEEQLEQAVRTIGYTRAAITRDIGEVTTERRLTAEQLGGQLARALLAGPTGDLYGAARSSAVSKGRGVRLWLSLGKAPGLLSVPWEFLYLQPTFLASQRKTPIVRFLSTDAPVAPRRIESSVRILGVVASPDGLPKLDVEQERKRVDDALVKARQDREVTIDWLDPATPKALRLALQKGDYHILHFVGHSGYTGDSETSDGGGGLIYLENEDHTAAPISDSQLVNLLGDQESLRLVVLNSCEGARTSARDPFAGIATSIVALGIPAVVAMQFEISDKAAIAFAEELYQSLIARQEPIDVAVAEARKAVFTEVNETEWATPVLFLRNEDGRLFDFAPVIVAVAGTATAVAAAAIAHANAAGSDSVAAEATSLDGPIGGAPPDTSPPDTSQPDTSQQDTKPPDTKPAEQPRFKLPDTIGRPLLIGGIAVAAVALLFGVGVSAGILSGPTPSPGEPSSSAIETQSPSLTEGPASLAPTPEPPTPSSSTPVADPTPIATTEIVPGSTEDEWVGPRDKSDKLAVAGGPAPSVTNISTVPVSEPGASTRAGEASDKRGVLDTNPAWDPTHRVIAFTRYQNGSSGIRYVVPGFGMRPDRKTDAGITVWVPIQDKPARGTHDHSPAWRSDGSLVFARTHACAPGPDCEEDIVLSIVKERIGDYIVPTTEPPTTISAAWSDVRNISIDPRNDDLGLVTGRNLKSPDGPSGVWIVDRDDARTMLRGSEGAAFAVFTPTGEIVGLVGGSDEGWGSVIAVWSSIEGEPRYIDAFKVLGEFAGTGTVPTAAEADFSSISPSPPGDGRFAVLISSPEARRQGRPLPVIALLNENFDMTQEVKSEPPPNGQPWNVLIGLDW